MALRCALLGHAFGDPQVERTRTRQGDRVAVTVRDVRTCARCGATDVVGERTEVTEAADAEGVDAGATVRDDRTARDDRARGDDHTTWDDRAATGTGRTATGSGRAGWGDDDTAEEGPTDDAVILDDDRDAGGGRSRGEWPRHERPGGEADPDGPRPWPDPPEAAGEAPDVEPGDWPDHGGDDDGFDARPVREGEADVEFGGGLTPERAGEPPEDAEIIEPASTADEEPTTVPGGREEIPPDRETEFVCPECGFAEHSAVASVRPGDVCPDCRSGYLEEHPAGG